MSLPTLYIAGPMTGYPEFNYPAFQQAMSDLVAAGYEVLSPHNIDATEGVEPGTQSWEWYMRKALGLLLRCDGVALLDGWEKSRGARLERQVANEVGMDTHTLRYWLLQSELGR
jgi:nucleoside 2-deoxyribosyltransferase